MAGDKERELLRRPLKKSQASISTFALPSDTGLTGTETRARQEPKSETGILGDTDESKQMCNSRLAVTIFDSSATPQPFLDSSLLERINRRGESKG